MKPLLSIIIPNYNNEMYLKDCFDGIVKQTYRPIEVVIVDDCSSDNSPRYYSGICEQLSMDEINFFKRK